MNQSREAKNKALVLEAFETLFNKRDYAAAEGSACGLPGSLCVPFAELAVG